MSTHSAIAVLELDSIAVGTRVADAMVKRAPIDLLRVGTVQPGKYIILVGGSVAAVEESHTEGLRLSDGTLTGEVFLPDVHVQVYESVGGTRRPNAGDALGVIETSCIPATVRAADKAVKTARVTIVEIRLGDGLGGKGIAQMTGKLEDVEAAVEAGVASIPPEAGETRSVVIPAQHEELRERVDQATTFHASTGHGED